MKKILTLFLFLLFSTTISAQTSTNVVCTGMSDHHAIRVAMDSYDIVNISGSVCGIGNRINMMSNKTLNISNTTEIRRDFVGNAGWDTALIFQSDSSDKVNNVTITGGVWNGNNKTGRMINWYGDNWVIDGITITSFGQSGSGVGSRAISWVGDNTTIKNNNISGSPDAIGFGGIIMAGGDGAIIENNTVSVGDDAIGFFPSVDGLHADQDIRNVTIKNCACDSTQARILAGGLHNPNLTATVENITVENVSGTSEGTIGLMIAEESNSSGIVRNISLKDITVTGDSAITINTIKLSGDKLYNISFDNLTASIAKPNGTIFKAVGLTNNTIETDMIHNLLIDNSHLDATGSLHAFHSWDGIEILDIQDSTLISGSSHAALLNTVGPNRIWVARFRRNTINEIPNGKVGINYSNLSSGPDPSKCYITSSNSNIFNKKFGATGTIGLRHYFCSDVRHDFNTFNTDVDIVTIN